jgi:NADPH-dependent ferric siderophore reductase
MAKTAILFGRETASIPAVRAWLGRAEKARRIAVMLSLQDADVLEAYARECEAEAARLAHRQAPAIAA